MVITITPLPKPRMTQRDRWAKRPSVVRYYEYCDVLRDEWGGGQLPERVRLIFGIPMPKSWSKRKRAEMDGMPHRQKPDTDNLIKGVLDALCEDDSYVYDIHATKLWTDAPYIVITSLI